LTPTNALDAALALGDVCLKLEDWRTENHLWKKRDAMVVDYVSQHVQCRLLLLKLQHKARALGLGLAARPSNLPHFL